ncbi:hypothetical protein [Pedobacter psychroterrae]|uniref:Uncharacterized protein n=1 Tax=Pedobacter psychroterrae TaxID=2530453 RepID=A0A4R0NLI4_9SPHI|nr:hypothetical protein [Pedobacter psychroterrae]TCC99884.1 hypothetical protein EZ437_16730 [Pedobacter psychroterrae]
MYQILLPLHGLFRWLVLIFLIIAVFRAYRGRFKKIPFLSIDHTIRIITVKVVQIQFCIGIVLYTISPLVRYFLHNFNEAVHLREIRFFGMEHITMMSIAVAVITIGSDKVSKATDDQQKYKVMAIWFTVGLLLILTSIPWSFSPLTSRPNFRMF